MSVYDADGNLLAVKDGSVTKAKLSAELQTTVDDVSDLKSSITSLTLGIDDEDGKVYLFVNGVKQGEGIELAPSYKVSYELMNATTTGSGRVNVGESYSAVLRANTGLRIDSVIVAMDGQDITSTAWNGTNRIQIDSVTAPVMITLSAVATPDTIVLSDVESSLRTATEDVVGIVNTSDANRISFAVITDTHGSANGQNSQNVCRYLLKNSVANKLFWIGDISNTNWSSSEYETFAAPLLNCAEKVYPTLGNHEYFGNSSGNGLSAIYDDFLADKTGLVGAPANFYYYFDDSVRKVRFVVINTSEGAQNATSATQLAWLNNAVQLPDTTWGIIALSHFPLVSSTTSSEHVASATYDIRDALLSTNGTVIAYITGHRHTDNLHVVDDAFYEFTLDNDSDSGQVVSVFNIDLLTRTAYMYRIGNGSNTSFDYADVSGTVSYSVSTTLTHCTSSSTVTTIRKDWPYTATIYPDSNYDLDEGVVTVTMGGVDVTSTVYDASTHTISITGVTGNIVITATAIYVAPVTEYTADWLLKQTSSKYPYMKFSSQAAASTGFPEYLTIIACNGTSSWPTGFRGGSYAMYSSRTSGYTASYHSIKDLTASANVVQATVDGKKYAYCVMTKAESDAAYAQLQEAISGGKIDNNAAAGIALFVSKANSLSADLDYWVLDQQVDSSNIESIIKRLPAHATE